MYEDDGDWGMYQDTAFEEDAGSLTEKRTMPDGESKHRYLKAAAAGKRMPVNREEVVRLILQGLKDMGYESVNLLQ